MVRAASPRSPFVTGAFPSLPSFPSLSETVVISMYALAGDEPLNKSSHEGGTFAVEIYDALSLQCLMDG